MKYDRLPGLLLFTCIVQHGSMTGAARVLGLSRSAVSKQLSGLEEKLGLRLLQRSTRRVTLTEAGRQVYSEAIQLQDSLEKVDALSDELKGAVAGQLKVTSSAGIGRVHLVPLLKQFRALYPQVQVHVQLEDRFVDLIDEQIDVAIRAGHLPDSSLVATRLGELTWVVCASPDYLKRRGVPKTPTDLLQHDCLHYRNNQMAFDRWVFEGPNGEEQVMVNHALSLNDSTALVQAAEDGQGIIWVDKNSLGDALVKGRLVPVLPDYSLGHGYPIYAVYPARRHLPLKTRKFIDFLADHFAPRLRA